ncbi:MAG: 23S rRNA (uracil(1939)-C(5))-methyltransferase RlmD [Cytophagales bacterium]|nr:23S rRNA (uracil(1939)-C(5))-methyltransferase RlmD [Cytophaga sp.]
MLQKGQIIESVAIEELGAEGKCVSRYNNIVIFSEGTVPGDLVDLEVMHFKKKKFGEAKIARMHKPSEHRVDPKCQHFGLCGGCKLQHIDYGTQLHFKQKQVKDNLERLGKIQIPEIQSIIGSDKIYEYRNKLDYTFSNKRWLTFEEMNLEHDTLYGLGFHLPGKFDKVLDIEQCHLQPEPSNAIRLEVKRYALEHGLTFYNVRAHEGFLRNLIIRTSNTNEVMVLVQFNEYKKEWMEPLLDHLIRKFPQITSLIYFINTKKNDSYSDQDAITYFGKPYLEEKMEDLTFRVGPKSFYQTNSDQAYTLYKVTRELAGLTGNEVVYDLYTGTGTIANFIARQAKQVIGIEYVEAAIEDAKVNSTINNISNTLFYAGDMKDVLNKEFIAQHQRPDVIITDPPRAGMHEDVVNTLLFIGAPKIVYVSCNPATQARDLALVDADYEVKAIQPVDMFPHTAHVENVVLLEKRKSY